VRPYPASGIKPKTASPSEEQKIAKLNSMNRLTGYQARGVIRLHSTHYSSTTKSNNGSVEQPLIETQVGRQNLRENRKYGERVTFAETRF
jgi:hypothetical protein